MSSELKELVEVIILANTKQCGLQLNAADRQDVDSGAVPRIRTRLRR